MAPNSTTPTPTLEAFSDTNKTQSHEKWQIVWKKVFFFAYLHYGAAIGLYYLLTRAKLATWIWTYILLLISSQGTGAGCHRLWAHRTYKAKLPLRLLLAFYQTLTFQKDIYDWVRDHRGHHKYSDTDCDPHNATRGFFFSHMGWLMLKKGENVVKKGKELDLSDLEADPVVMFQRKYYWYLAPVIGFIFPSVVPWYFWSESYEVSWYICNMMRYFMTYHATWLVNSAAHIIGTRPYDKNILPTQNLVVSYLTNGEGFHNYHHAFPWDYKAAELGSYYGNWTTAFIDIMAKIGWAYDLKSIPHELVERKVKKSGDGTWRLTEDKSWGWGDKDMKNEEVKMTTISYKTNLNQG